MTTNRAADWLCRAVPAGAALAIATGACQLSGKLGGAYLSPADPIVWATFLFWLICAVRQKRLRSVGLPPLAAFLLILAACLSIARAANFAESLKKIFQWVEYFLVAYMVLADVMRGEKALRFFAYLFMGLTTVIVLVALTQYLSLATDSFKVRGTFGNRNILGGFLSLALPVAYGLCLYERRRPVQAWLLAVVIVGGAVTLSGGTLVALAVAIGAISVARGRTAFLAFAVVLMVSTVVLLPRMPRDNIRIATASVDLFDDNGDVTPRYTEWQAALNMWKESPAFGVGAGNYQVNIGRYYGYVPRPNRNVTEPDSHNLYLVLLATTGLAGTIAFMGLLIGFVLRGMRAFHDCGDGFSKGLALGAVGALVAFMVNGVWSGLLVRGLGIPLVAVCALIAAADSARDAVSVAAACKKSPR